MIEITEPVICASRGRNTDNPNDRTTGISTEQRLELKNDGCSNTLTTVQKDNMVLEPKIKRLGNLYDENAGGARAGNVYAPDGLAPALQTAQGGNRMPLITEPIIAASRGRNPDNPSDRTTGLPTEQRLEVNTQGISNTLTTVGKDNYVVEPKIIDDTLGFEKEARIYDDTAPTLRSSRSGLKVTDAKYRIRKLTPRECFRLMGFTDNDFDKIHGISNTQLYKMAGNSIVVNVLEAIFKQLFKESEK